MIELPPISHQIWDAKYRLKRPDGTPIDETIEDTHWRVAHALAALEEDPIEWVPRFMDALIDFKFIPAGRILAGAGTDRNVTLCNCYVMGKIEDSLDGIFSHLREAALTMQQGGGIGYDFSTLRPKGAFVKGVDADASGPLSFMDVWDAMCKTLMSAGARRGAMMACMRCDHPDVVDFITAKREKGRLTQFNMSVLVTDAFMEAVKNDNDWLLQFPTPNQLGPQQIARWVKARHLWNAIMSSTYDHAEPGVIFIDRINKQNNLHYCETISATNPCFAADTFVVTDQGCKHIKDLVGSGARIWDGEHWVHINTFRVTGHDQKILKITLQDGATIRVTPKHNMVLQDGREINAEELQIGDELYLSDIEYDGNIHAAAAYLKGFLLGDGSLKRNQQPNLYLYEPKYCCTNRLISSALELTELSIKTNAIQNLGFVEQVTERQSRLAMTGLSVRGDELREWCSSYKEHLPDEVFCWDRHSKLELITGLFDSDGTYMDTENGFGYQISSIHRTLLIDLQILLKGVGVRSKLSLMKPAGTNNLPGGIYNTQDCWRLIISQKSSIVLAKQVTFARLLSLANRTTKYNVKCKAGIVMSIIEDGIDELVYCCTVPISHKLSLGIGIITGQCGEEPLPPYGSCDLGSINLAALVQDPFTPHARIDPNDFEWLVPTAVRILDNVYDVTRFPLPQQAEEARLKRRLGLGITGLANALAMCGLRYGTMDAARQAQSWTQSIEDRAYTASCELAKEKGAFPLFNRKGWLDSHTFGRLPTRIRGEIAEHGMRNSHLMAVAPTGTISLFAGNVSGGIEPPFALQYTRKVLQKDGTRTEERVEDLGWATFRRLHPDFHGPLPEPFVTAQDLTPDEHLVMLAAVQSRCDTSISKTINLPKDISFADFKGVYIKAYELGCKSCTTYRPNDVTGSVLSVDEEEAQRRANEGLLMPVASDEPKAFRNAEENYPYACPDLDQTEQPPEFEPAVFKADIKALHKGLTDQGMTETRLVVSEAVAEDMRKAGMSTEDVLVAHQIDVEEDNEPHNPLPSRPDSLPGRTYKVRWTDGVGDHAYYVTINDDPASHEPFEIFINSKCVEHQAWITALTRMVSAIFRRGGDLRFVAEELMAVVDPRGGAWIKGKYVTSLPALIGQVLERHMTNANAEPIVTAVPETGFETVSLKTETATKPTVTVDELGAFIGQTVREGMAFEAVRDNRSCHCPKCGVDALTYSEGCAKCLECGWSRCE